MSATRRTILQGLAALPVTAAPLAVATASFPDPILAAIAAHRAAVAAMNAAPVRDDSTVDACIAVEEAMLATRPTTGAGLLALVEHAERRRLESDSLIAVEYFPAILAGCRALLPGGGS